MNEINRLLELSNEALEDVMATVHIWCRNCNVAMSCEDGQNALTVAAQHRKNPTLTPSQLLKLLTQ